jgi:hypothetical protein
MMTTYTPFVPNPVTAFNFLTTLDGTQYSVVITWNMSGQRWYLNIFTLQNVPVLIIALIPSPDDYDFNLLNGFFYTSTLVFRESSQTFEISP